MIDQHIEFVLPVPWSNGLTFQTDYIGPINFLVGPNGSGKSQFASQLMASLANTTQARLLGTDRLSGMERASPLTRYWGDPFSEGFAKDQFRQFKQAGTAGSGIDTIVLLEERLDLRIRIEATLSHLFDREINLDWDSGRLIPKVTHLRGGGSYRLDRDECHGIKELLVMLSHLYDAGNQFLIIDEPELNLHPQYQAFFMQEVRRVTSDPNQQLTKIVFLVTHSPFILDLQTANDLRSVISFDLDYTAPKQVANLDVDISSMTRGIRRMNSHHKQLFFSDNPILVEGIHDAWLVEAIMEARGMSVAGAGSCIIPAGGVEEVNQYLKLCQGLGKTAHFLYDLDSLFRGTLRRCIGRDESIRSFLASAGLGTDFAKYCGQLDRTLTRLIDYILTAELPPILKGLHFYIKGLGQRSEWKNDEISKARTAVMTAISRHRSAMMSVAPANTVENIEGRLGSILAALREKNIHVLSGGTIERYLPLYEGDIYAPRPETKLRAVHAEIEAMASIHKDQVLRERYGDLYEAISLLPSKEEVDVDPVLRNYLSSYVHELQRTVVNHTDWQITQIQERLRLKLPSTNSVFSLSEFERFSNDTFQATIAISEMLGSPDRVVRVDESTNAGMGSFTIENNPLVKGN